MLGWLGIGGKDEGHAQDQRVGILYFSFQQKITIGRVYQFWGFRVLNRIPTQDQDHCHQAVLCPKGWFCEVPDPRLIDSVVYFVLPC